MRKLVVIVMFNVLCLLSIAQVTFGVHANDSVSQPKTGSHVLYKMHELYNNKPCKRYSFSQTNTHYKNDSVIGTSEWHEYIEFPDKFRIDFEETAQGNFVIFKNDSAYRYKKHALQKTLPNANTLLLLLGGMYYRTFAEVIQRLTKENYNTAILSKQTYRKTTYYVIGALKNDSISNQIWVNKKNYRIERIIEKIDESHTMDMSFNKFQKLCGAYTETVVTFKNNGKIEQREVYFNIKSTDKFDDNIFTPIKM